MEKSRLFISLNVKGQPAVILANVQKQLKEKLGTNGLKWEDQTKFHLTLRFLGDVKRDDITALREVLRRLKFDFEQIEFTGNGIGFFPESKFPNVVYAALTEEEKNSEKLVEFIDKIIYNFGIKPEKRFIPHITLGRFSRNRRIKLEKKPEVSLEPLDLTFSSFFLMKSVLQHSGSIYEVIDEFEFKN